MVKKQEKDKRESAEEKKLADAGWFQMELDLAGQDHNLIIDAEETAAGKVRIRIDSNAGDFSLQFSRQGMKKLAVAILRHLKGEEGIFYGDKFLVGRGPSRKQYPAQKILRQYQL